MNSEASSVAISTRINEKGKHITPILGLLVILMVLVPLIIPEFWVSLLTEILILGLAGMAVNLLLGYGGSLAFGHGAFYASGAYALAILIKKTTLSPYLALVIAPLIATVVGAVFGLLVARLYRFYYAIMTTAFSMMLWALIRKWQNVTGGDDGITGVSMPSILTGTNNTYFFTLIIVLLSVFVLWRIINSPFGWTLRAVRENAGRVAFTGNDVVIHRYLAFIISSFFTGIAGALYVVYSHSAFPDYAYWIKSGDMVLVCILGGMFYFFGPLVGVAILILLQTMVTSATLYWPLVMGIIICGVVLFLPDGVMGIWKKLKSYFSSSTRVPEHSLNPKGISIQKE